MEGTLVGAGVTVGACVGATVGCVVAAGGKVVPSLPQSSFSLGDVVIVGACVASTVGEVVDTGVLVAAFVPVGPTFKAKLRGGRFGQGNPFSGQQSRKDK